MHRFLGWGVEWGGSLPEVRLPRAVPLPTGAGQVGPGSLGGCLCGGERRSAAALSVFTEWTTEIAFLPNGIILYLR